MHSLEYDCITCRRRLLAGVRELDQTSYPGISTEASLHKVKSSVPVAPACSLQLQLDSFRSSGDTHIYTHAHAPHVRITASSGYR